MDSGHLRWSNDDHTFEMRAAPGGNTVFYSPGFILHGLGQFL